jgi:hypothetical protein
VKAKFFLNLDFATSGIQLTAVQRLHATVFDTEAIQRRSVYALSSILKATTINTQCQVLNAVA